MHNQKFKIDLVERCKVENKQELKQRERFYIESNTCTNHNIPARTRKETYTAYNQKPERKEELQRYYQLNKDKIKENYEKKKKSKLLS